MEYNKERVSQLYNAVIGAGFKPSELGKDASEFAQKMIDKPERISSLYNAAIDAGFKTSELGKNAAEFGNNMGIPLTEPTKEQHVNSTNTQAAPQNEEKSFFDKAKDFLTPDDQTLESLKGIGKEVAKAAVPILAPAAAPMVGAINAVNDIRNHAKQEEDAKPVQNISAENPTKQYLNRFDDFNKSVSTLKDDGVWSDAAVAKDLAKKAQYRIQEGLDSKTDGAFGQFVGSFWKNNDVSGVWTAGVSDARNAVSIYNAVKQYNDNPSKVTPEQEAIVKALYFANEADNVFGNRTMWQQAGSGAMQTAEFGTEFLASAGIGSIAKKIGTKLGIKLSTEALEAMTKKAIQKAVFGNEAATKVAMTLAKGATEATVKGAAQTALTGYGHVKAGAYENMVGQTNSGYDENGHFQFNGNTPINKDPYDAWMHSLISQNIENTTEYAGETLSYAVKGAIKQAGNILNKIPKIKLTRGVGDAVNTVAGKVEDAITPTEAKQLALGGFLKKMATLGEKPVTSTAEELQKKYGSMAYLGLEAKKYVNSLVNSPIYKTAGIHSLPEEWLEEQAGTILNAAFTGDSKISDLADGGQQLQTLVSLVTGCGLMGGIHKAVGPHGQGNFESENSLMAAQRLRDVITSDPKLVGNNPDQILGDIESYVSKYGIENQAKFISEMNTSLGLDKSGSRALTQYALSLDLLYAKKASQKYEDMENAFKHNKRIANSTDEQGNVKMAKLNGADVVVKSLSDDHATVEDYEGTKSMIPVSSLQGLTDIPAKEALIDTEDLKLSKLDISKEELVHQVTPDEAKQNKFNPGDVLSVNIGGVHTPATVDEMTADGNVVVNFATPVSANGKEEKMTWSFSPEEISNIIQTDPIAHTDGEQGVPEESPEYPTTKDGLVDYKAITNPNELVMAIGETEGEKSLSSIDAMLQEANKSLTETEALPAEEKTQRQNQINNWIERLQRARVSFDMSPTTEEDKSDAQSVTQPTAEQEKAPMQFPHDKDGNIDYKQIDEPQMYASALQEEFGKDANTIVDEELNSLNKQLEATAKKGSAVQKARARKNLSAQIEKMNSVKQFIGGKEETKEEQPPVSNEAKASDNKQEIQTPSIPVNEAGEKLYHEVPVKQTLADINDGSLTPDEAKAFIEANKKAAESSLEKLQKKAPKIGTNKEDYLAQKQKHSQAIEGLQRIADYWQSVKQEAEKGHEEEKRAKAIKEDELNRPRNISELASQMLGGDIKLLWNDSGNGVIKKKGVKSHTGYSDSEKKNILGILSSSENGGMSIEEAGERVEEHAKELGIPYDETDATAGMDALLNVLSSSRTWGDMKNYVHKTREDEARKQAEAEEAEYEDWVERKYHMSSKEYDAWNDTFDSRAESYFNEEEKAESEIFPIFAELENKENERRREAEKVPVAERSANGNSSTTVQEVLQGSPTRGDFKQSEESGSSDRNLERQGEAERSLQDGSSLGGNEQTGSSRIEQATSSGALDVAKAETEVDPNPTEAQKEAGNYKKGHVKLAGYDISIENPVNSIRRGVDENGKPWEVKMNNTYGYFRGTKGKDGDHIDTFLSSGGNYDGPVYVIDQVKPDGSFDESKVMLGFNSEEEAKKAYLSNYSSGWKGLGNITGVSKEAFDDWMSNRKQQRKPFAEYVNIASEKAEVQPEKPSAFETYVQKSGEPIRFSRWKKKKLGENKDGQFCHVERVFTESGSFSFTAKEKINSPEDVAYIFKQLENAAIENSFIVLIKKGKPIVIHLGMGDFTSTAFNAQAIKAAYESIKPDKMVFVHNHPSGHLIASNQDQRALISIRKMFPKKGLVADGIIINTTSGKFCSFGEFGTDRAADIERNQENALPVKVYSFDTLVFSKDYKPETTKKIKDSSDVAGFISSHRLGERQKISYLILDQSNGIVGNIHTPYTSIEDNKKELAEDIATNIIRFGGMRAIPYGDFKLDHRSLEELSKQTDQLTSSKSTILDAIKVDGLNTVSASSEGIMEKGASYNSANSTIPEEQSIIDEAKQEQTPKEISEQFNKELEQQINGTLPKGHIYRLGKPGQILKNAGIPNLPIELVASKLKDKSMQANHPFDLSDMKELVTAIQNPIAVFDSKTRIGSKVILTEITDRNGNNYVVAIQTNSPKGSYNKSIQINSIKSVYPKSTISDIINWINRGDLLKYADKTKILNWITQQQSNSADVATPIKDLNTAAKIIEKFEIPSANSVKLSESSIQRHKPISQKVISKNAQPVKQKEVIDAAKESAQKLGVEVRIVSSDEIVGKNESDKRQSKGWYDPLTGRVYLVANNAENVADAIATVMHEAVGHKGLRSLLGIRFHAFLGSVYTALPHETQSQMQTDGIPDTEKIEELLARYAEDEKYHKELSTWQKIRGAFNYHMSKIMGRPFRMNDTNLRYLFYRAAESKNAGNELKAVASLKDESVRKRLFGKSEKVKTALLDTYSKRTAQPLNKLFTIVVDKLHPVKILQQELEKQTGKGIEDFENVYQAEMLRSSKTRGIADNIERIYYKPFINAVSQMVDCGLTPEEVNHYMMAKHMPERNDHMREEKMSEGNLNVEGKDFAGASALMKKIAEETQKPDFNKDEFLSKKGFSEEQYNDLMSHYESGDFDSFCRQYANIVEEQIAEQDPNLIEKLWETTNALNQTSVRLEYRSGILSKEKYDEIISMYNNYVPLRGWDQTMAEDLHKYTTSATSLFNDPLKGANGRASLPDDVIATMSNVITSAIEISEKNRVGKALLYLSQNHPGKLLRTASVWYVENGLGEWEEKYPTITPGMEEAEINEAFRTFNETMEALEAEGKAKKQLSKVDLQVPFEQRRHAQEHVVYAYVNGVKHSVFVNGDPIVAQLINGTAQKNVERITWKATKVLSRWLASSYTTRNPNFILSNFSRDNIFALTAIIAKEDLNYLNSYRRNYRNSVLTLRKYFAGKVDKSSPEFEALNRFLENGGETGFSINISVEDWKNKYQKMIDEINGKELTVTKAASAVSKFTNDYNRIAELVSRFNTYQTSISQGRSVSRAVMDAKEVTVNFNRTGLGGEGFFGQTFAIVRGSYVFFNAGIQGLYNISKLYKSHPIKMTGVTLATFTMGSAVMPMLNNLMLSLFGSDDDKKYYDNLPDYMANNNLVLFTPVGGFITIPLPIELRSIYGMGRIINEYAKGNRKQLNLGADLVKQFSAILPVDPMEGGRAWWLPSVIRPLGEAYIYNENFYGGRISNDSYYNENDPEYTKAPKGTGGLFKFLSEWSNSLGNDDKLNATKNSIGLLDWNPAKMEHVFEGYFGGSFKVVSQISNTVINGINAAKGDEEFTTRNVPLLNVLFRTEDETIINRAVNEKFYEYKGQVESREKNAAIYKSIYKSSDAKVDNTQKETAVKEYIQMMRSSQSQYDHTFDFYNEMISKLYKSIDSVTDKKQKELLQNRINDLKENAVIEYEKNIPLLWEDHEKEE